MALLNTNIGPERVQVIPQPLGSVQVPGVATSITAMLISTSVVGAPLHTPTPVTTLEAFTDLFGGADEAGQGYYAAKAFFDNAGTGNTILVVNVGSAPTVNDYIGTGSDGKGLRSLDGIDVVGLVCAPGLSMDKAWLVQPAVIDYAETIRAEFGATLSTTFALVAVPKEIQKANTDVVVVPSVAITSISGPDLQLPPTDLSQVKAGMVVKKAGVIKAVVTSVNDGSDLISVSSTTGLAGGDSITVEMPSAVTWKEVVINSPSKAAAWYFNWTQVLSEDSVDPAGSLKMTDPVGSVAGVMARIDANTSIGGVSHAPAGIQYAGLAGVRALQLSLSERLDAEPLRENFINRITSFPGAGFVVFGGYTADSGTSPTLTADEQLVQVIRSVQFIKGSLERGLRLFLWENFSPSTQEQVGRAIASFLRGNSYLFPAGLPEAQQFQVISVEPTQDELDVGLLRVRVQIKPNKAVRFIEIALEFPLPTA